MNEPTPKLSAINAIVNSGMAAKVWCALFFVTLIAAITGPYLTIAAMKQNDHVIVLDPATDTEIYTSMNGFQSQGELAAFHANLAIAAALLRHPTGPDNPQLMERIFLRSALKKITRVNSDTAQDFATKQIEQKTDNVRLKVEIGKTIEGRPTMIVHANGIVTRSGVLDGVLFREPHRFLATLYLTRNPDMLTNNKLPMCVYDWDYQELANE